MDLQVVLYIGAFSSIGGKQLSEGPDQMAS